MQAGPKTNFFHICHFNHDTNNIFWWLEKIYQPQIFFLAIKLFLQLLLLQLLIFNNKKKAIWNENQPLHFNHNTNNDATCRCIMKSFLLLLFKFDCIMSTFEAKTELTDFNFVKLWLNLHKTKSADRLNFTLWQQVALMKEQWKEGKNAVETSLKPVPFRNRLI